MAKLYNVYYHGISCDFDIRLPEPTPDIRYAECSNWEREILVPRNGEWVEVYDIPIH